VRLGRTRASLSEPDFKSRSQLKGVLADLSGDSTEIEKPRCRVDGEPNSFQKPCVPQKISSVPLVADEDCSVNFQRLSLLCRQHDWISFKGSFHETCRCAQHCSFTIEAKPQIFGEFRIQDNPWCGRIQSCKSVYFCFAFYDYLNVYGCLARAQGRIFIVVSGNAGGKWFSIEIQHSNIHSGTKYCTNGDRARSCSDTIFASRPLSVDSNAMR